MKLIIAEKPSVGFAIAKALNIKGSRDGYIENGLNLDDKDLRYITMIDEYCDNPSNYKSWQLREAINDAETHYLNGSASKSWYESVVRILSKYI